MINACALVRQDQKHAHTPKTEGCSHPQVNGDQSSRGGAQNPDRPAASLPPASVVPLPDADGPKTNLINGGQARTAWATQPGNHHAGRSSNTELSWKERYLASFTRTLQLEFKVRLCVC